MRVILSKIYFSIPLFLTGTFISIASLIAGNVPVLAYDNNCSPVSYYKLPGQGVAKLEPIITATIVGNSNCRVYLYGFNNSGDLVKLNNYGVVGDKVEIYSVVWGYEGEPYYQIYFPNTRFWAWLPETYLWPDNDNFSVVEPHER
jgi:hypothetical protein